MAFARSASGPGALSINTGAANLFGSSTSQAPGAGGLSGNAQQAQSGGLFGTASSQPAPTGSLFGGATSQPQQTGGLFGGATQTLPSSSQAQPSGGGGLFGTTAASSQPQQSGGLFGSAAASQPQQQQPQQQQQQQQQQQPGGLFGSATSTQQPQQQQQPQLQQTGGLFGSTANTASQQQQKPAGMFASTASAQPQQPGGLFGASTQQQPQQQPQQASGGFLGGSTAGAGGTGMLGQNKPAGSLFGGLNQPTNQQQPSGMFAQSAFGPGLTMGQSTQQQQQQQQVVPGVRIDVSNIRTTTRFNDLQEDIQNRIAEIDKAIQGFMAQKSELDAFMPAHGEQVSCIPNDVNFVGRKAAGVEDALGHDAVAVKQLRELVKVDADNARLSFKAIDNLKLPSAYHQAGLWSTRGQGSAAGAGPGDADGESNSVLVGFFSKTADEMDDTMRRFEQNLGEIEMHLHAVQGNVLEQLQRVSATPKSGGQSRGDEKVVELAAVLRDFEESILKVAGVVGGAREGVTSLQLSELLGNGTNGAGQ